MQREFKSNTLAEVIHQATQHLEGHKIPTISHKGWSTADFIYHFYFGRGRAVSLRRIGYLDAVRREANRLAINRPGGFKDQIRDEVKRVKTGRVSEDFERSYEFGNARFELGGGVLRGVFNGRSKQVKGWLHFSGKLTIEYSDTFEDIANVEEAYKFLVAYPDTPESVRKILKNSTVAQAIRWLSNFNGTPYPITASWHENFTGGMAL